MELWIRSQNKKTLVQVDGLKIWGFEGDDTIDILTKRGDYLGEYKTKERALEVLDEIQEKILRIGETSLMVNPLIIEECVYEMPKE